MGLATLHPVPIVPDKLTSVSHARRALRRVERVHVGPGRSPAPSTRRAVYAVEVHFHQPQRSHIPIRHSRLRRVLAGPSGWPPDTSCERTWSDFMALYNRLFHLAESTHGLCPCRFCFGVLRLLVYSDTVPSWPATWFLGGDKVRGSLTTFLNALLGLVFTGDPPPGRSRCAGHEAIIHTVAEFLGCISRSDDC